MGGCRGGGGVWAGWRLPSLPLLRRHVAATVKPRGYVQGLKRHVAQHVSSRWQMRMIVITPDPMCHFCLAFLESAMCLSAV